MTSVDDPVLTAIRCADADGLAAALDPSRCPPATLRLLVRHEDARLRALGLVCLAERLEAGRDEDRSELAEFAASLPGTLDGSPEASLALAHLRLRLRSHLRDRPWPQWRKADLPVRIQIAWLSAEIADRPETVRDEPPGELLYQAVRTIGVSDVDEPERLARELIGRLDPVLRSEALRVTREALRAGLLAPERARTLVVGLTGTIAGEPAASAAA